MSDDNKNPEQIARDEIDARLRASGWAVQDNRAIDHSAATGVAVREYKTSIGPADYVMFAEKRPLGVVEAKPESWGARITTVEEQSSGYAAAQLKWVKTAEPLPFIYESTGTITRFTDGRDPKPRSREVFSFHRPETLRDWLAAPKSFRAALQDLPPLNTAALRDCQPSCPASARNATPATPATSTPGKPPSPNGARAGKWVESRQDPKHRLLLSLCRSRSKGYFPKCPTAGRT